MNDIAICPGKPIYECPVDEVIYLSFVSRDSAVPKEQCRLYSHSVESEIDTLALERRENIDEQNGYQLYIKKLLNYLLLREKSVIVILDEQLFIKYYTPGWERLVNNKVDRFYGKDILRFIHPHKKQSFFDQLNQCVLDGDIIAADIAFNSSNEGDIITYQVEIIPNHKIDLPSQGVTLIINLSEDMVKDKRFLAYRYEIREVLSNNNFAKTYMGHDHGRPGSPRCIIKQLKLSLLDSKMSNIARRLFYHEALSLEMLGRHDQILLLLAYLELEGQFFLVQDFIEGDHLGKILEKEIWTEKEVIIFLKQMLEILVYVHSQQVIHRDIKPENIIRRSFDGKYVLIDFGSVKLLPTSLLLKTQKLATKRHLTVPVGTPGYMPPEQKLGHPQPASDLYSLGIIAIEALTRQKYDCIRRDWHKFINCSPYLKKILEQLVAENIENRYCSAKSALQDLSRLI